MKMTKPEIMEYVVAFVGIVGLLAYIHVTAAAAPRLNALSASPMVIEAGWPTRADAGYVEGRLRGARIADIRV